MQVRHLGLVASAILLMTACSDSDGPASREAQTYSVSLTEVTVVKQGSDDVIVIDGLPAGGATLTGD